MTNVLVTHPTNRFLTYFGETALERLRQFSAVKLNTGDNDLSGATLVAAARDCDVVIAYRQTAFDEAVFSALPGLVAVVRCAVDIRTIDVSAASRHGVLVTQASPGFMASVSEWAVGVMIDLSRHIGASSAAYRSGELPVPRMGRELRGATLGVIGFGAIGRYLCRLAHALGMRILVSDPHVRADDPALIQTGLPELLALADYVVCLAPATPSTENLMDARAFSAMRPGSFFVNASRGNLVDETALLHALDSGHLAGAALDVGRAADQMPSPALARHPRVIATPHVGGLTPQAIEHQALETVEQTATILQGRSPHGAVNAAQAHRLQRTVATGKAKRP